METRVRFLQDHFGYGLAMTLGNGGQMLGRVPVRKLLGQLNAMLESETQQKSVQASKVITWACVISRAILCGVSK